MTTYSAKGIYELLVAAWPEDPADKVWVEEAFVGDVFKKFLKPQELLKLRERRPETWELDAYQLLRERAISDIARQWFDALPYGPDGWQVKTPDGAIIPLPDGALSGWTAYPLTPAVNLELGKVHWVDIRTLRGNRPDQELARADELREFAETHFGMDVIGGSLISRDAAKAIIFFPLGPGNRKSERAARHILKNRIDPKQSTAVVKKKLFNSGFTSGGSLGDEAVRAAKKEAVSKLKTFKELTGESYWIK